MANLQAGAPDAIDFNESFQQPGATRYAAAPFQAHESSLPSPYRPTMPVQSQQGAQHHPPVPPDRQLSSMGQGMPYYDRAQPHVFRQGPDELATMPPQRQYGNYGNPPSQWNYGLPQDTYSQMPARTLPPPTQQYGGVSAGPSSTSTYPQSDAQQTNQQSRDPQHGNGSQYPYGQYPGSYR